MKYAAFLFSLGALTILFLVSCQAGEDTAVPMTQTPVTTPTALAAVSTATPTPTATIEATPLPTATATQTAVVTLTPLPTLPPDEAVNKVIALLQDNQNPDCLLPCWWGVVPGQTQWDDVSPYLESFALKIDFFPEQSVFVAMFPVTESINYRGKLNIGYGLDTSEIVSDISIASINIEGYDPQTMMTLYGIPDEVWLKTFPDGLPGDVLPFQLIIVYQEEGISFYYYVDASRVGEMVTVCFEPGIVETERPDLFPAGPRIYIWEPGQVKTIDEIANVADEIYYPLEERADLTPQTLYEKFTNPNESPCIDTPSELWEY